MTWYGSLKTDKRAAKAERLARYRKGRFSELVAATLLLFKGYRIVQWRMRNRAGEIDLIARRGQRVAFIEVKYRPTFAEAEAAITPAQQRRLIRAAELWIADQPGLRDCERAMDAIFICPWRWPRHEQNAFYFD